MVIQEKTSELARYLSGRMQRLDYSEPSPILERSDNRVVRKIILNLTQSVATERGIGKNTFHYLRKRALNQRPFKVYKNISGRLLN